MPELSVRHKFNSLLLDEADLEGMAFNTPVPFYDVAVSCGYPKDTGDVPPIFFMMPDVLVGINDTFCSWAIGDSMIGSKDDMSVAFVYNLDELKSHITDFIQYQINIVTDNIRQTDERIQKLESKINSITSVSDEKTRIDLDYARQDIERAKENRVKLLYKHDVLMQQLSTVISNTINYGKEE